MVYRFGNSFATIVELRTWRLVPDMAYNPFTIDEYEVLACCMNTLAAEYHRTHDEKIKAEIFAIASQLAELQSIDCPKWAPRCDWIGS